jgi:hypothetical protein
VRDNGCILGRHTVVLQKALPEGLRLGRCDAHELLAILHR